MVCKVTFDGAIPILVDAAPSSKTWLRPDSASSASLLILDGPRSIGEVSPVVLRPARPSDDAPLRALYIAARQSEFAGLPAAMRDTILEGQFRARTQGYAASFPDLATVVMADDDALVGQLSIARDPGEPSSLRIVDFMVAGPWRGLGLGAAAIALTAAEARDAGYAALTLQVFHDNPAARRLYERLGFVTDDRSIDVSGMSVSMSKALV